jgi:hydrogenase expression/formation protein HypD
MKARGYPVHVIYSPADALDLAGQNARKKYVFIGIGFETTAPLVASTILQARRKQLDNVFFACAHKTMPNALLTLAQDKNNLINGFILPAHVSTIIGRESYEFLAKKFRLACVIAGFEPTDILMGILMLLQQLHNNTPKIDNQYFRVAKPAGNIKAREILNRVFEPCDDEWRGLGNIPQSGLKIRDEFSDYDVFRMYSIALPVSVENKDCRCGDVLKGMITPPQCPLFARICKPEHPIGACMVSSEGSCAAFYKYGSRL